MKNVKLRNELKSLKEYLIGAGGQKAKDYLVFPLFQKLFGQKFKKETDAAGADIYIEGKLVVELKSDYKDILQGFYQAMHYEKKGLSFSAVCVIANRFIGLWHINKIPDFAKKYIAEADPYKPANLIGILNANKTRKDQNNEILMSAQFRLDSYDFDGLLRTDDETALIEFVNMLKHLDSERQQINQFNFITKIEYLKKFFDSPIEAIHCFYIIANYWDITSTVSDVADTGKLQVIGRKGSKSSEPFYIKPTIKEEFKKFVENHFVFTNEGSGLSIDYYFSHFDEVISKVNPEYAKQHGIFFTDISISRLALWFVRTYYEKKLSEKYIVLDPAGGSGNLVTSWKDHLKHKIVSELQPDLLKTIERRMKLDPEEIKYGFTIIPKTSENKGLNFLDKSAEEYVCELMKELRLKNLILDKPLAFLLNPPYKSTDENISKREKVNATYIIHPSIIELTGRDAGKERYLAFLGQILNIARLQSGDYELTELDFDKVTIPPTFNNKNPETPLLLIFTPTSWLIPRPTFKRFREIFDKYFKYEKGFIFLGNEFFDIKGKFPISFTIWRYNHNPNGNNNIINVKDLTHIKKQDINNIWHLADKQINMILRPCFKNANTVNFSGRIEPIKNWISQFMYDFKRSRTATETQPGIICGGLPLDDTRRKNKKTYGTTNSKYIGFMDDNTPVRIKEDRHGRITGNCDIVWLQLFNVFQHTNRTRILSGPPDKYGYSAFDLISAQRTFTWYAITKVFNGIYPIWANQFDIWKPNIKSQLESYFYSLCFAFGLADNVCVVTKYEADNPVKGAPEVFVDNPLCPINPSSFWSSVLDKEIRKTHDKSYVLLQAVKELYNYWNNNYCKSQFLYDVGLKNEPYFKYFHYRDFITPYSGLVQIKKYAEIHSGSELMRHFTQIAALSKIIKQELYNILFDDFKYFSTN